MGSFLVMKNNLKRNMYSLKRMLLLSCIPIGIIIVTTIISEIQTKSIYAGVIGKDIRNKPLQTNDELYVNYENVDLDYLNSNLIMKQYNIVLDYEHNDSYAIEQEYAKIKTFTQTRKVISKSQVKEDQVRKIRSIYLMIYMIIASIYAVSIIRDKKEGLIKRFVYAGNNPREYTLGSAFAIFALIGIQTAVGLLLLNWMEPDVHTKLMTQISLLLYITTISTIYGVIIASLHKKELNANLSATAITAILYLLSGQFVPVEQMPKCLQILSAFSPMRWIITWF